MTTMTPLPATGLSRRTRPSRVRQILLRARPRDLLAGGVTAGLLLCVGLLGQQWLLDRTPFGGAGAWTDVWVALVHCLLAGYLPATLAATVAGADRAAAEVAADAGEHARPAVLPGRTALAAAALAGLALGILGPWLTEPDLGGPAAFWIPARWSPESWWHRILGLWITAWFGLHVAILLAVSRSLGSLAEALLPVDLFDREPFLPFVRQSLLQALAVAGAVTLVGLLALDEGLTLMLLLFGGGGVVLMAAAGLLPLVGVRGHRSRVRTEALRWCGEAIRSEARALRLPDGAGSPGRLADLVAYRGLIEAVSPWPFDFATARRFMLYLLIPLLSWVASAVVQEVVQQALRGA